MELSSPLPHPRALHLPHRLHRQRQRQLAQQQQQQQQQLRLECFSASDGGVLARAKGAAWGSTDPGGWAMLCACVCLWLCVVVCVVVVVCGCVCVWSCVGGWDCVGGGGSFRVGGSLWVCVCAAVDRAQARSRHFFRHRVRVRAFRAPHRPLCARAWLGERLLRSSCMWARAAQSGAGSMQARTGAHLLCVVCVCVLAPAGRRAQLHGAGAHMGSHTTWPYGRASVPTSDKSDEDVLPVGVTQLVEGVVSACCALTGARVHAHPRADAQVCKHAYARALARTSRSCTRATQPTP